MSDDRTSRYPRGWIDQRGPSPQVRWAAAHPWAFAGLFGLVVAVIVGGVTRLMVGWAIAGAVGVGAGLVLAAGSLYAQRDLRRLLAQWDEEHPEIT